MSERIFFKSVNDRNNGLATSMNDLIALVVWTIDGGFIAPGPFTTVGQQCPKAWGGFAAVGIVPANNEAGNLFLVGVMELDILF